MNKNEQQTELLEKMISKKMKIYNDLRKSSNNDYYFERLNNSILSKINNKKQKAPFTLNPSLGYAFLFVISFIASFNFIHFENEVSYSSSLYLFSETSLWVEEEAYISDIELESLDLDYADYISDETNYSTNTFLNDGIKNLSESQFDAIYENIKSKKIL